MKLLITGCNGQLGRELRRQLAEGGSPLGPLPEQYAGALLDGVDIEDYDVGDRTAVMACLRGGNYDVVFNCAAMTQVDACESQPETAFRANALAAQNVAMACELTGARLVHVSTDYVFSGDADTPYREYDVTGPRSVYGKTKLVGETLIRECCNRYFIVRTQWLYGDGRNFVRTIAQAARKTRALKVVDDQYGCPTSAVDLASHLLRLALSDQYGVYHCVNHGVVSWYTFACEILKLQGIDAQVTPCTTREYPTPAARPEYSALDNLMLRLTVGDNMRSWEQALESYIEDEKKREENSN